MYSADVVITPTTQLKYSRKETRLVSGKTNVFGRLQTELLAHGTCVHLHVHSCTCSCTLCICLRVLTMENVVSQLVALCIRLMLEIFDKNDTLLHNYT